MSVLFLIVVVTNGPLVLMLVPLLFSLIPLALAVLWLFEDDKFPSSVLLDLQRLGIRASRPEPFGVDMTVIQIEDSPIQSVSFNYYREEGPHDDEHCVAQFIVPDRRVASLVPPVDIQSVRVRSFPFFGKVKDVRWEGSYPYPGLTNHLAADSAMHDMVVARGVHKIRSHSDRGVWVISVDRSQKEPELGPVWAFYENLARYLLAWQGGSSGKPASNV